MKAADGSWRWIEVKAWARSMNADPKRTNKTIDQSFTLKEFRERLKIPGENILLAKEGIAGILFLHYKLHSKFDKILFAFPAGN